MGSEGFYGRLPQLDVIESHGEPQWEVQHGRLHRPQSGTTDWREPVHALAYRSKRPDDDALQPLAHPPIALARWLQQEILAAGEFSDQTLPVVEAVFARSGDSRSFWTEIIDTVTEHLALTWYDFGEPFVIG